MEGLRERRGRHHHGALVRHDAGLLQAAGGRVRYRAGAGGGRGRVGRAGGLAQGRRGGLLVGPPPDVLHVVTAHLPLLVNGPVKLGGVVGLGVELRYGRRLDPVLVGRPGDLLARASLEDARIVPAPRVIVVWS